MSSEILILDDSRDDCELMSRALKQADPSLTTTVCMEPEEALTRLFDEELSLPRVVFLDLRLSPGDGHEVLHEIRSHPRTRSLPVVVVSGSNDIDQVARSYALGANSHIHKPIAGRDLSKLMGTVGRYWARINAVPAWGASAAGSND